MEKKLSNEIKKIIIDVVDADVAVFYDKKAKEPSINYNGKFDISEEFGEVKITQHRSERKHKIVNVVGSIVISDEVHINDEAEDDDAFVNVILPTLDGFDCDVKAVSSNVSIEDVTIENLYVYIVAGDVEINNAIIGKTDITTTVGDVDLTIDDSKYSYNVDVNIVSGCVNVDSIDMSSSKESKELKIEVVTGNISITRG